MTPYITNHMSITVFTSIWDTAILWQTGLSQCQHKQLYKIWGNMNHCLVWVSLSASRQSTCKNFWSHIILMKSGHNETRILYSLAVIHGSIASPSNRLSFYDCTSLSSGPHSVFCCSRCHKGFGKYKISQPCPFSLCRTAPPLYMLSILWQSILCLTIISTTELPRREPLMKHFTDVTSLPCFSMFYDIRLGRSWRHRTNLYAGAQHDGFHSCLLSLINFSRLALQHFVGSLIFGESIKALIDGTSQWEPENQACAAQFVRRVSALDSGSDHMIRHDVRVVWAWVILFAWQVVDRLFATGPIRSLVAVEHRTGTGSLSGSQKYVACTGYGNSGSILTLTQMIQPEVLTNVSLNGKGSSSHSSSSSSSSCCIIW